ncbi:MAG: extracellular solute-binding protein [Rhodomicrobiaceae bacterium]
MSKINIKKLILLSIFTTSLLFHSITTSKAKDPTETKTRHGISMHGTLKYEKNFPNFDYARPNAPKGGGLDLGVMGTFTNMNPLNIRGGAGAGVRGYVYESLLGRALDEPFSLYGLIAEKIDLAEDRSTITFYLNGKAKFSDGKQITTEDVIFTHKLLKENGRPNHRTYYSKVIKVEKIGENGIKFTFKPSADGKIDREMPLIMGLMPILPKHKMTKEQFKASNLNIPLGSGPYTISEIDPGKFITYKRNPNHWAKDLPVNKGRYNFDQIKFTYYRDANSLFEAFKKGLHDVQYENDPGKWSKSYNFNAIRDGRVLKKEFALKIPSGMSALVFNTRRSVFKEQNIRKALISMFNFEGINRQLYHGLYSRTKSYFDRSTLSSVGKKADDIEQKILSEKFEKEHTDLWNGDYKLPVNRSSNISRKHIRKAMKLFKKAGYKLVDGKMINQSTNEPFEFEIMTVTKSQEALLLSYIENLKLIGVKAIVRQVDTTQYQKRKSNFDFDMIQNNWSGSLSPGNEQLFRWSSKQANTEGSYNFAGIKNPQIDQAIDALLAAKDQKTFISSVRSLDRLLLAGDYVIPLFHLKGQWLAHRAYLAHPEKASFYGSLLDFWWDKRSKSKN